MKFFLNTVQKINKNIFLSLNAMTRITFPIFIFAICFTLSTFTLSSQFEVPGLIRLKNPSFEDKPKTGSPPKDWLDCGFTGETGPDVHPGGFWEVKTEPLDGNTYLGMVVRSSDTWERVSQLLEKPMQSGQCYSLSIFMSRTSHYISGLRDQPEGSFTPVNFIKPCILRIWGGNENCGRAELLAQSPPVDNEEWKEYILTLKPKKNYSYLMLEAFYVQPVAVPYNGHILLDFASDLIPMDCAKHKVTTKNKM